MPVNGFRSGKPFVSRFGGIAFGSKRYTAVRVVAPPDVRHRRVPAVSYTCARVTYVAAYPPGRVSVNHSSVFRFGRVRATRIRRRSCARVPPARCKITSDRCPHVYPASNPDGGGTTAGPGKVDGAAGVGGGLV